MYVEVVASQSSVVFSETHCTSGFVDDVKFSHNGANGPKLSTALFRRVCQVTVLGAKSAVTTASRLACNSNGSSRKGLTCPNFENRPPETFIIYNRRMSRYELCTTIN